MPSEPQSNDELIELIRHGAAFSAGTVMDGHELFGQIEALLAVRAAPDFVTVMHSESAVQEYDGLAGFREALTDWMSPYERFRLAIEEVLVEGNKVVFLVRQLARTHHQSVEIETPSASVWWLVDGRVKQAVFYLDQQAGLKAAGIGPDRRSGD
jgi:ketosteroid isomerase-like protein